MDAVVGDEGGGVTVDGGNAGRGDGFLLFDVGGDLEVEGEELGEEIGFRIKAICVEDSGIERGVGVFERVSTGELEGAVEGAEAAFGFW